MGQFVFHVPLRGNVALLFGMSAIFLVGVLSMGHPHQHRHQEPIAGQPDCRWSLTFLPAFLLSGFMFPIVNMPRPIQMDHPPGAGARTSWPSCKGIYLKGVGLEILGGQVVLLVICGLVMVMLARVKLKKKLT